MGLAGVRTSDNMELYNAKRPLAIVYFDVDYERNPKGENLLSLVLFSPSFPHRQQLLEKQVLY